MQTVSSVDVVKVLNEFVALDRLAAHTLCETRVSCSPEIEKHPTLIPYDDGGQAQLTIGLIGVLNGIVGLTGDKLVAHYDDDGILTAFSLA